MTDLSNRQRMVLCATMSFIAEVTARLHLQLNLPPFAATSGPVACSSTAAPHEFFGHMGIQV